MESAQKTSKALALGAHRLGCRAFLAPLSGVTDLYFRRIASRCGAGLVVSEMVASDAYLTGQEEARLRAEGEGITPHVVQLAGCQPKGMAEAARLAEASGADVIDINMGCPAKRVTGGYAGSALMRDLDLATSIIAAVAGAVSVPFTVKMRLGWDEMQLNAPELGRRAEALGASAVAVHGRTRQQFYKGRADWHAIAPVAAGLSIPIIANGDVGSAADARRCLDASGAAAVMIGRASLGQPWIVGGIGRALEGLAPVKPDAPTRLAMVEEHYAGLLSSLGREVGVRHARKHLSAYADRAIASGHHLSATERARLVTTDEPAVAFGLLRGLFATRLREAA